MKLRTSVRVLPPLLALALLAGAARASDPAAAQRLFDQARKLMLEERWAEACPKLEESQRLDPGGGTVLHLALCHDHEGKIATAWAGYREALEVATRDGRKDRMKIAQARIDALEPRMAHLRIRVSAANRTLVGFQVLRDGTPIGEAQWGQFLPVDPGKRTVVARADGYKPWTSTVVVPATKAEVNVSIPALETDIPTREADPVVASGSATGTPSASDEARQRRDRAQTLGFVAAGAGAAGLVVGSVFGILAFAKHGDADAQCQAPARTSCTPAGVQAGHDSTRLGNISTVAFSAAGVFLAAGAILYYTAPTLDDKPSTTVWSRLGRGEF